MSIPVMNDKDWERWRPKFTLGDYHRDSLPLQQTWVHPLYPQCNCDHCKRIRILGHLQASDPTLAKLWDLNMIKPNPDAMRPEDV